MFAYSVAIAFGGVEAADAEAFGIVYIDGLHAGTEAADAAEMRAAEIDAEIDRMLSELEYSEERTVRLPSPSSSVSGAP